MNAKLAKALRRKARDVTEGAPAVTYAFDATKRPTKKGQKQPVIVHPRTTKGAYRMVKKHVAKERRA